MTRTAFARVTPSNGDPRPTPVPRPRRALACRWERCPVTGALACRWEVAAPDLTLVGGSTRERGQPPSPLSIAA